MKKLNNKHLQLKETILQKNNRIVFQQKQIEELQEEKKNILKNNEVVSKIEFDKVLKDLESKQINYKTLKDLYDKKTIKNNMLIDKCENLTKKNGALRRLNGSLIKNATVKTHNERGAGRKSHLTKEQLEKVEKLRDEGLSYKKIGEAVGISKTYAYKLINNLNK